MDYEYKIRTDLAIQNKNLNKCRGYKYKEIIVKKFYQNKFNFTNILFNNIELKENKANLKTIVVKEINSLLKKYQLKRDANILVVGLGNKNIVGDSLGVKTVSKVTATGYLKEFVNIKTSTIYTFMPGVFQDAGYMAFRGVKALVKELKIDLVLITDSLISDSIEYLNKLIQISDIGITPGSGICNYQEEISLKTLKVPVIVVGVPTAIEASSIIRDVLNVYEENIRFKDGYDLIVSKKDIDIFVNDISVILSESINEALK